MAFQWDISEHNHWRITIQILDFNVSSSFLPNFVPLISSSLEGTTTGVGRRKKRMMKQEKMTKALLQAWHGLLDHCFSLLHQEEHSLNDTDSKKKKKENMKGLYFSDPRAVRNTLRCFSDWFSTNIFYSIVHKIFVEDLDGPVDRPLFIKYLLRTWIAE